MLGLYSLIVAIVACSWNARHRAMALLPNVVDRYPRLCTQARRSSAISRWTHAMLSLPMLNDGHDDDAEDDSQATFTAANKDDLSDEAWQRLEAAQPSEWMVMKELLGINVFTYLLAAAIAGFLGLNALLGPGWLGNTMGIQGTGTFTETSSSLPNSIDLTDPEFRL